MGVLYVRVGGSWVPIGNGAFDPYPAYVGPRLDYPSDAWFGRAGITSTLGIGMRDPTLIYFNFPSNGQVQMNPAGGSSVFQALLGRLTLAGWAVGAHPAAGQYQGLWRNGQEAISQYVILANSGETLINVPASGAIGLRQGNSNIATFNSGGLTVTGAIAATTSVTANGVTSGGGNDVMATRRFYQQGDSDHGPNWNQGHFVCAGAGYYGARVGLNYSGSAVQMRVGQWKGEAMEFVAGDASVYRWIYASAFQVESTIEAKKDVRSIYIMPGERPRVEHDPFADEVPDIDIMALRPVAFRPKIAPPAWDPETETFIPQEHPVWKVQDTRERIGLIAEEVQHIIPSAVGHNEDGSAGGIDYAQITVALLGHVQQLTATIETLKYRISELENANECRINQ